MENWKKTCEELPKFGQVVMGRKSDGTVTIVTLDDAGDGWDTWLIANSKQDAGQIVEWRYP